MDDVNEWTRLSSNDKWKLPNDSVTWRNSCSPKVFNSLWDSIFNIQNSRSTHRETISKLDNFKHTRENKSAHIHSQAHVDLHILVQIENTIVFRASTHIYGYITSNTRQAYAQMHLQALMPMRHLNLHLHLHLIAMLLLAAFALLFAFDSAAFAFELTLDSNAYDWSQMRIKHESNG